MDSQAMLLDEVALEGLDGITLSALWQRLQSRVPVFPQPLDQATRQLLWQSLAKNPEMTFYKLPLPRDSLLLVDRYEEIDFETGILESRRLTGTNEDIYPVHMILDDKNGIKGSCQFFRERVCVSDHVRTKTLKPCCTLEEAVERWGETLVIVASQSLRYRALIGWEGDPEIDLPDYSYCILERLGRARWQGELQRDLHCGAFKVEAGKIHYHRRVLDENGLISLQSHVIRLQNGTQQHSVLLLLKRFHVDRRSKYDILMERISTLLKNRRNYTDTLLNLREELGLNERTFKRLYQYMIAAGIGKVLSVPLQELHPDGGPCKTKKGTDVIVRCLQLLKDFRRKTEDDDDDENDSFDNCIPSLDIVYEQDMLTQALELIESVGTKGISQSQIRRAMNVGKLEARMICRLLERYRAIKGFMEDEGRQRTTKYVSHVFVEKSHLNQQFEREKARSEQLATDQFPSEDSKSLDKSILMEVPAFIEYTVPSDSENDDESRNKNKSLKNPKNNRLKSAIKKGKKESTPIKGRSVNLKYNSTPTFSPVCIVNEGAKSLSVLSDVDCSLDSFQQETVHSVNSRSTYGDGDVTLVEEIVVDSEKCKHAEVRKKTARPPTSDRPHETYRLLRRRNMIVESVRNLRLIESLFSLQKTIMEQERQDGVPTKCCKKSIVRLVHKLSQEGLLRLYQTTVIQDGFSKKVQFVAHPSVNPNDPLVKSAIEQIRFRMSNSHRIKPSQSLSDAEEENQSIVHNSSLGEGPDGLLTNAENKARIAARKTDQKMGITPLKDYHPVIVPGLGRTLGFLPKMPRLKLVHTFLWYIIYGHPLSGPVEHLIPQKENESPDDGTSYMQGMYSVDEYNVKANDYLSKQTNTSYKDSTEELVLDHEMDTASETVYVDDDSWMRYVPTVPLHREFGYGWALVSDILLCLPLSVFIQIVQVSYKVDDLENFLNDPLKKHTLIRFLPRTIRQKLLYKRRYIFSVMENLQRLCCMGLVQFGPTEKFQDKDQIFVYVKRNASIIDTTTCDPHYNLAQSSRPFERCGYRLSAMQDLENFWFDLQCVCLNTPLGVVRHPHPKKMTPQNEDVTLEVDQETAVNKHNLERKCAMLEYTTGSRKVTDDGSIPGDGLGCAGLDSSFYGHLKRNWIWTSYIINKAKNISANADRCSTVRLQTFISKHSLASNRLNFLRDVKPALHADGEKSEPIVVQVKKEIALDITKKGTGGKNQKRKRPKKDSGKKIKLKRKKKDSPEESKIKKYRYHDEADQSALQRMTRLRVAWTAREDGLLMLCRIASHVLNKKVKRPFVPWQVVRDIMHANFEESLDKTSHSVGRRSRYIVKNRQTYLNYKVCLAEVYQDKVLVDTFMSLNKSKDYKDPDICAQEFKEFVERLKVKLSSTVGTPQNEIPDTLQELFTRHRVLAIGDEVDPTIKQDTVCSVDDIHLLVLQNLIQSTLALSDTQMKSFQSFQTFRMYREYRDEVLVKAFVECQKRSLVNRRRINQTMGPKKSRALPFVPMSYQLSQTYYRHFTWRFPSTICMESFQFLEMLKAAGTTEEPDSFSIKEDDTSTAPESILFSVDGPGGHCITLLSLLFMGLLSVSVKIPEQIVVVDSTMVENEVLKTFGKDILDDDDDEEDLDETSGNKRRIDVKARQASHTNYLLMRGYYSPGIVSTRNLNPNDNVVVNSCQVNVKLRRTPAPGHLTATGSSVVDDLGVGVSCLPDSFTKLLSMEKQDYNLATFLKQCIERFGYNPKDVSSVLEIRSAIEDSSYNGMAKTDIEKMFLNYEDAHSGRTKHLADYIQDLQTLEQVFEVGANTIRFVAMVFAQPWLLHSLRLKKKEAKPDCFSNTPGLHDEDVLMECMEKTKLLSTKRTNGLLSPEKSDTFPEKIDTCLSKKKVHDAAEAADEPPNKKAVCEEPYSSTGHLLINSKVHISSQQKICHIDHVERQTNEYAIEHENLSKDTDNETIPNGEEATGEKQNTECVTDIQEKQDEELDSVTERAKQNSPATESDAYFTTSSAEREYENICFIGRPWRIVDGSLNKPVCKGMMEAVLYHIMTKPGITEQTLMQHYKGVLQPVAVLEILQGLQFIGCVKKSYIEKSSAVSLFSPPVIGQELKNIKLHKNALTFYEPTVDCTIKLGRVFPSESNWNKWVNFIHI